MKRMAKTRADEANELEVKRMTGYLEDLKRGFAHLSLQLEWTLTPSQKLKPPKGYHLMEPTWSFAECPKCRSHSDTYSTSTSETDRPYSHYDYFCAICGETWKHTKIWD